jgi:hypothetical protein
MTTKRFFQDKFFATTIILSMALVASELSGIIIAVCGSLIFIKWIVEARSWTSPTKNISNILVLVLLVCVLFVYRTLADQDAAYTFLLGLSGLKVLDFSEERDRKLLILIGFILVSTKALFSLDFYWLFPSAVCIVGLWYNLLPPGFLDKSRFFFRTLIFSLPITFLLFILFPRIIFPWTMGRDKAVLGRTGFSNSLRPGDVAEIFNDGALVFRARQISVAKNISHHLYWKGTVLDFSEGLSWSQGSKEFKEARPADGDMTPSFEIVLESIQSSYLFVLDGTKRVEAEGVKVLQFPYQTFRVVGNSASSLVYRGFVLNDFRDNTAPTKVHLQMPKIKGRVLKFVNQVNSRGLSIAEKLSELQNLFIQNEFRYTFRPGSYEDNDLEEFLFVRRKGFCEHFAGAYATIARAIGIPSRVVLGFYGGQFNPYGQFLKVTNKDAHAWVEIYHEGFWQRVDPTTWIAPLRFEIGAEAFFSLSESDQFALARLKAMNYKKDLRFNFWKDFFYWIEDLNYQWTYFLIEYQPTKGNGILGALSAKKGTVLIIVSVGVLLFYLVHLVVRRREHQPNNVLLLREVEEWGKKRSFSRQPHEPPLSYFSLLRHHFPEMGHELEQVYQYFDQITYAEKNLQAEGVNLLNKWKKLSLKKKRSI